MSITNERRYLRAGNWAAIGCPDQEAYVGEILSNRQGIIRLAPMNHSTGYPRYEFQHIKEYVVENIVDFWVCRKADAIKESYGGLTFPTEELSSFADHWNKYEDTANW